MGALLHFLSLLLFLSLLQGAQAATFTISNRCGYTVWPGILSNAGVAPPSTTGFALSPGQTLAVSVAAAWFFKGACPRAYSYAYDDATSTFTCAAAGGGYDVVFCPGMSSLKSGGNPEAVGLPPTYSTMAFTGNAESLTMSRNSLVILLMIISSVISTLSW
uniref:Thaumatin-like protein n=1 Tax=Oryza barthii TaxID=65489 RepID=A0A0D3GKV3_9ORYZ